VEGVTTTRSCAHDNSAMLGLDMFYTLKVACDLCALYLECNSLLLFST
jgi:hypothetical protein